MSKSFHSGNDSSQGSEQLKQLSSNAKVKGIGSQAEPTALTEISVHIGPSSLCRYYAEELYDSIKFAISYRTGASDPNIAFTMDDLYVYFAIILRERINQVNKARTLFSPRDPDVRLPHFFYLMIANIGEVIDERRHLWLKVEYLSDSETESIPGEKYASAIPEYKLYGGSNGEKMFVYTMSKHLRALERYGLVNGTSLPRDTEGTIDFLLFIWAGDRLLHSDPEVEPALSVLASLLSFARDTSILNPYIPYGGVDAYRALLKDISVLRNVS